VRFNFLKMMKSTCSLIVLIVAIVYVNGHGRLLDPAGRSTIWRTPGFGHLPHNYNDNQLFCGGYQVQYEQNGGRCGICGDNFADPTPRENENGGTFGRGVIAKTYASGSVLTSKVELTSNHLGFYRFAVCPLNGDGTENDKTCQFLQLANGSGDKYPIGPETGFYTVALKLPEGFTCAQCTFQWTYTTGNSWGWCDDDHTHGAIGCGDQETFRGCADIAIV